MDVGDSRWGRKVGRHGPSHRPQVTPISDVSIETWFGTPSGLVQLSTR